MAKTIYLKPAPELTIPDPATGKHLPATGDAVDDCPYWRRRLREKSVEFTTPAAIQKACDAAKKTESADQKAAEAKAEAAAKAKAEAAEAKAAAKAKAKGDAAEAKANAAGSDSTAPKEGGE